MSIEFNFDFDEMEDLDFATPTLSQRIPLSPQHQQSSIKESNEYKTMKALLNIKKPSKYLINYLELIGILIDSPQTSKSKFKINYPTTFDYTYEMINNDFNNLLLIISSYQSCDISAIKAFELFERIYDIDYNPNAVIEEGGEVMETLNEKLQYIISILIRDKDRHPVDKYNIYTIIDDTRVSHVAFDVASQLLNHGMLTISIAEWSNPLYARYLQKDITRRCKELLHLPEYKFCISKVLDSTLDDPQEDILASLISQDISNRNIDLLVLGIQNNTSTSTSNDTKAKLNKHLVNWSLWGTSLTCVIIKNSNATRPFVSSKDIPSKCYLISVKSIDVSNENSQLELIEYLQKSLQCMRPIDTFIILHISPSSDPIYDYSENTRFEFGRNIRYISNSYDNTKQYSKAWNDDNIIAFKNFINNYISRTKLIGRVEVKERRCDKFRKSITTLTQDILYYSEKLINKVSQDSNELPTTNTNTNTNGNGIGNGIGNGNGNTNTGTNTNTRVSIDYMIMKRNKSKLLIEDAIELFQYPIIVIK